MKHSAKCLWRENVSSIIGILRSSSEFAQSLLACFYRKGHKIAKSQSVGAGGGGKKEIKIEV